MKRTLSGVLLLALVALALFLTLRLRSNEDTAGTGAVSPGQVARVSATELAESSGRPDASPEGARSEVPAVGDEPVGDGEPPRKGGEFKVMTEGEFLIRLRELGLEGPRNQFDRLHGQKPNLGAVVVLVSNEESAPVPRARVLVDPASPETLRARAGGGKYSANVRRIDTDNRGIALFPNVSPTDHLIAVEHRDYLTKFFGTVQVRAGENTYVETVLERAQSRIEGLVSDMSDNPLPGVSVTASRYIEGGIPFTSHGTTGYDGRFSLGVVTGSQNSILATKLGYRDGHLANVAADTHDLHLSLERTGTVWVEGFVTRGLSSEPITEFRIDSQNILHSEGRFRIERNIHPEPQTLTFSAEGFEPTVRVVDLSSGDDVDLGQVPLHGERSLNGIVRLAHPDGAPRPQEGATVSVLSEAGSVESQVTGMDGLFSFRGLTAETVQLSASAPGTSQFQDQVQLLEEEPTYVEILLHPGEYRAWGFALEESSGEPIEGVQFEVVEHPGLLALSGPDGAYELTGIPSPSFTLRATKSGYKDEVSPPLTVAEEEVQWDARMEPSGLRLRFQVAGQPAPAGTPVFLWIRIEPTLAAALAAQQNIDSLRHEGTLAEEGEVTFDVEDGDYFVHVPAYRLQPKLVQADSDSSEWISIQLPGSTALAGRILNSDGTPVANTSLWLHSGDQDYSTMSLYHTDEGGNYSIPNLAPRPYALSIIKSVADQSAQHVRELIGQGAPQQTFHVTFPPLTASVSGRLTDESGAGKGGVQIGVEYLDAPHRSILAGWVGTDAEGNFQVPRLEPGRHILRTAWTEDECVFSEEFTLTAGEHKEVNLVAPQVTGKHLRGHMIASDGGPLGGNFVFATDSEDRQNGNFFSSMDWGYVGPFDIGGLKPDTYRIDVTAMGCIKQATTVHVTGDVTGLLLTMEREN